MDTQRDHAVETSADRTTSWRDKVTAEYEIQQAVLRFRIAELGDTEEFI